MITANLYQPFEIEVKEASSCPLKPHKHNFFELAYIIKGTGIQHVNKHTFSYKSQHLFLLFPEDHHCFAVHEKTTFFFLRFNKMLLAKQKGLSGTPNDWIDKLSFIYSNYNHLPGCILKNKADKPLVKQLVSTVIRERERRDDYHNDIVSQLVITLITLVARNLNYDVDLPIQGNRKTELSMNLIHYVQQNIYSPQALRAEEMARHFNISVNYISEYFRKHTGETLQQYIIRYKLKLVEMRLLHSDMRVNEIAYELNFTDESHLNRIFKKYRGVTPTHFKRETNKG